MRSAYAQTMAGPSTTHEEVLEQAAATGDLVVRARREVARLLKKHGVGPVHLAHVDRNVLQEGNDGGQSAPALRESASPARLSARRRCSS